MNGLHHPDAMNCVPPVVQHGRAGLYPSTGGSQLAATGYIDALGRTDTCRLVSKDPIGLNGGGDCVCSV